MLIRTQRKGILLGMEAVSTMKISTAVTQEVKNASTIRFSDTDSGYLQK